MAKKLLIAEDEESLRALLVATLQDDSRYGLITSSDGEETLSLAREELPDLIFLDILMPKMDGIEVCRALKADERTRGIKIVMITALTQETNRKAAMEAGADDYVTKPFSPIALLEKVDQVLGGE